MNKIRNERFTYIYTTIITFIVAITIFTIVTLEVTKTNITNFDEKYIALIQGMISDNLTSFIKVFTEIGSVKLVVVLVFITGLILFFKRHIALSIFIVGASVSGGVLNIILKRLIQRERPEILQVVEASGYSFPSGHSMGSMIFYGSLAYLIIYFTKSRLSNFLAIIGMATLIVAIGLSRIYLGVHFPTDVVAGFAFGLAWLLICVSVFRYYELRKNSNVYYVKSRY